MVESLAPSGPRGSVSSFHVAEHHGSHRDLLRAPDDLGPGGRAVDATIVPTVRPLAYLSQAAGLAQALGCTLVTLHSKKWTSAAGAARRLPRSVDLIAIDVPDTTRLALPEMATSRLLRGTRFAREADLSDKRNLGLMLSSMLGWSCVLFLDDDITVINPVDVQQAASLLGGHDAVGLFAGGFPGHSVVCHAYRQAGGAQQSFIGGGALAVEIGPDISFFPRIYNEDWFFLLDSHGLRPVAASGRAIQAAYDPFRDPDRARSEELGEVLAEGIYWLLDQGSSISNADQGYWCAFLVRRSAFIHRTLTMVYEADIAPVEKTRRIAALKASLGRLAHITPVLCENYLQAWTTDLGRWQRHLQELPTGLPRKLALATLSRDGSPTLPWRIAGRGEPREAALAAVPHAWAGRCPVHIELRPR